MNERIISARRSTLIRRVPGRSSYRPVLSSLYLHLRRGESGQNEKRGQRIAPLSPLISSLSR